MISVKMKISTPSTPLGIAGLSLAGRGAVNGVAGFCAHLGFALRQSECVYTWGRHLFSCFANYWLGRNDMT